MKYALSHITLGIEIIMRNPNARSVTVFCGDLKNVKGRVRFTRKKGYPKKDAFRITDEISMTIGKPNYAEREFLALCKKAGTKPRRYWISRFFKR